MAILRHSAAALSAAVAAPVGALALALRPAWRERWRERLGGAPRCRDRRVWIHAASVGEVNAALPLASALAQRELPLIASTTRPAGLAAFARALPSAPRTLAPLDHPWCVARALDRVAPRALALVETEVWPAWVAACARRGVPVVVVSGRISDRAWPRYRRAAPLLRPTFARLSAVAARSQGDAERFVALGAHASRVIVAGDLKLDAPSPPPLAGDLERALARTCLFVAGSTHPGEEAAALDALDACEKEGLRVALALAPRRVERCDALEREIAAQGRPVRRRTRLGSSPVEAGEVLLVDTLGELGALYTRAALAFVGGTLVPLGGHNIVEPVLAGAPVLFGPHTANAEEAATALADAGGCARVRDAEGLAAAAVEHLRAPLAARARVASAREALARHSGAAERCCEIVVRALPRDAVRA